MTPGDSPLPYPNLPAGTEDHNTSISLNVHVVPPLTEGQDVGEQLVSTSINTLNNAAAIASNTAGNEIIDFGAGGVIDPFFDDLFSNFTGVTSDPIP